MMRWCSPVWGFLQRMLLVLLAVLMSFVNLEVDAPWDRDGWLLCPMTLPYLGDLFPQPGGEICGVDQDSEEEEEDDDEEEEDDDEEVEHEHEEEEHEGYISFRDLMGERIHELLQVFEFSSTIYMLRRACQVIEEVIREALHPVLYGRENPEHELDECPICLMPYSEEEEISILRCGHYQHYNCIKKVLLNNINSCVICRARMLDP